MITYEDDREKQDFSEYTQYEIAHHSIQYIREPNLYGIYGLGFTLGYFKHKHDHGAVVLSGDGHSTSKISDEDFINCLQMLKFLYTIIEIPDIMGPGIQKEIKHEV